jgi:hypothetical protein
MMRETVSRGQKMLIFRKQKAGGRDRGECCSNADEGSLMTGRK